MGQIQVARYLQQGLDVFFKGQRLVAWAKALDGHALLVYQKLQQRNDCPHFTAHTLVKFHLMALVRKPGQRLFIH